MFRYEEIFNATLYIISALIFCRVGVEIVVVLTSECPSSSCTSFGVVPFAKRLKVLSISLPQVAGLSVDDAKIL